MEKKRKADQQGSEVEDVPSEEDLAGLVELLSKEQLATIVKHAALTHVDSLEELRKLADEDPAQRKIFVRGLSWTSTGDVLQRAFEKYGPVSEAVVISDKNTGKSKGFGFVSFKHRDACVRALKEPSKIIEGRMTVCHLSGAAPANTSTSAGLPSVQENVFLRKIYVGNLPKTTQGDALLEFFSQYGEIEEGPLGFDRETEKCKGFAILIYKSVEAARKCLEEPIKEFGCQQVQCKLADANKIGAHLSSSVLGYNMTNPAAFSSYNPSLIQGNAQSMGQSSLQPGPLPSYGVQGLDPLGIRTSVLLGPDSAYNTSSLSSGVGLGAVPQSSIVHASRGLSSLQPVQNNTTLGQGYNSLPRRLF